MSDVSPTGFVRDREKLSLMKPEGEMFDDGLKTSPRIVRGLVKSKET